MEQLKSMKSQLVSQVQAQFSNLPQADYRELGAAVDMIKDLAETEYYCSVVKAMEEQEEEKEYMQKNGGTDHYYYTERYMPIPYQRTLDRDMDREYGRMYYENPRDMGGGDRPRYMGGENYRYAGGNSGSGGGGSSGGNSGGSSGGSAGGGSSFYERAYQLPMRDMREGRSPSRRRQYMESKEMHQPKEKQMHELDSYMQELSGDITDMIHGSSPEEKQMLQQKLQTLITKIDQVS